MRKIILFFFVILFTYSKAQNKFTKGVVLSTKDSLPLAYVNIYSDVYKFGVITNELGEYILNYPDSLLSYKLTYSSMGFLTKELPLYKIKDTIYLKPSEIMLDEVILHNANTDISYVLNKVYQNIKRNYSNKRHLLKAFYRQTAIKEKDSSYLRIVEADVGIQEYGILKTLDRDRIKIYHYRRSDDKITKKWYHKVAYKMFGKPNNLFWLKKKDFVKNFVKNNKYSRHYKSILRNYNFEITGYQTYNNHLIAIYSFYRKEYENLNIKEEHKSKLYINLSDYAIIKVIQFTILGNGENYNVFSPDEYSYTKIGNFYYLNNVINRRFQSGRYRDKETLIEHLYVYQVESNRKEYKKIKRKEKEKIMGDVYEKNMIHDTLFWSTYKFLPAVLLKDKMKTLLQKDKTIKQQFLDNGKKQ